MRDSGQERITNIAAPHLSAMNEAERRPPGPDGRDRPAATAAGIRLLISSRIRWRLVTYSTIGCGARDAGEGIG